jgi:A/G-specific adenine glycosylase
MKRARVDFFREKLLHWHKRIERPMPWKGEKDPYRIWISEIMLQQTRVEQATEYYNRFLSLFPNVNMLASADEEEVLKAWEGLGYYRRAKHLHHASRTIVEDFGGSFPHTYEEIIKLKGIGPYTAAAISSFAFGIPKPVIDGNVERIIARYEGIREPIINHSAKRRIAQVAQVFLDKRRPAAYNQAIMDFGARQCRPGLPDCSKCPLRSQCYAYRNNIVRSLPVKTTPKPRIKRYFHYLLMESENGMVFSKRPEKDIWSGMFEPPLIERNNKGPIRKQDVEQETGLRDIACFKCIYTTNQILSHQQIFIYFYRLDTTEKFSEADGFIYRNLADAMEKLPMPKSVGCFLRDKWLHLKLI